MSTQRTIEKLAQKQNAVPHGSLPVDDDLTRLSSLSSLLLIHQWRCELNEENY